MPGAESGQMARDHQFARLVRPDLLGLAVNAWLGWWWLDACAGLAVAAVAVKEGRDAWREVAAADPARPSTGRAVVGQRGRDACQVGSSQRWPAAPPR